MPENHVNLQKVHLGKVAIGTGRLGRALTNSYKVRMCKTMIRALTLGANLHVSPTYGKSFGYLRKFRIPKFAQERVIVKVDFSSSSMPELQIQLARDLFPDPKSFEVQISGDLRLLRILQHNQKKDFFGYIDQLKNKYKISKYFFSPLYHDCESFEQFAERGDVSWAIHSSLVEREFTEDFFVRCSDGKEIIFLRAFGEGLQQFGSWYFPLNRQAKPLDTLQKQQDGLVKLLTDFNITEDFARLYYTLHHPANSLSVLSVSNGHQLDKVIEVLSTQRDEMLWSLLEEYSRASTNFGRHKVGFFCPPNVSYIRHQSVTSLAKACSSIGQRKIIFRVLLHCCLKLLGPARFGIRVLRAINRILRRRGF